MAGHSRWAQVKHKKAGSDAKRGALFSKLGHLIRTAAHAGGTDPRTNSKLRRTMEQARDAGMPKENIERAIARAEGNADESQVTAREYEAYGPGGTALVIGVLTDSPNRTTAELKHVLGEHGGKIAAVGSVDWLFRRWTVGEFEAGARAEVVELLLIDAGAEDTALDGDTVRAFVRPERFERFREAARARGLAPERVAGLVSPKTPVVLSREDRLTLAGLVRALKDHDDVASVSTNAAA